MAETGTHAGMFETGDDRKLITVLLENLKVRRGRIVFARFLRNEIVGMQSERRADADHTPWSFAHAFRLCIDTKGIEPRESERDTGGADESAAWDVHGRVW